MPRTTSAPEKRAPVRSRMPQVPQAAGILKGGRRCMLSIWEVSLAETNCRKNGSVL